MPPVDLSALPRQVGARESSASSLARELRRRIALGELVPGERLPTVRHLANALGVHTRVVGAAYAELRADGLVEGTAGAGTRVARRAARGAAGGQDDPLGRLADDALSRGLAEGFQPEDVAAAVARAAGRWRAERAVRRNVPGPRRRVLRLAGSHDLSVEVLVAQLGAGRHPVHLVPDFGGSLSGLLRLAAGEADLAAVHLLDPTTGEYNAPFVRRILGGRPARLLLVAARTQGLMVAPGNPLEIRTPADLARPGLRLANRQAGSGTRTLLDTLLARAGIARESILGYDRELPTHLAVAEAVARGEVHVGLGIDAAARALGLGFVPVAKEPYELAVLEGAENARRFGRVRQVLASPSFKAGVAALGGYDTSQSGTERAVV